MPPKMKHYLQHFLKDSLYIEYETRLYETKLFSYKKKKKKM